MGVAGDQTEIERVVTAALLHDLAVFAQRASVAQGEGGTSLGQASATLILHHFPASWSAAADLLSSDQSKLNRQALIVELARQLASGDPRGETASSAGVPGQLAPVFSRVALVGPPRPSGQRYHLSPLALDRTRLFPSDDRPLENGALREAYEKLWQAFTNEVQGLTGTDTLANLESLLALLQKYAWCVPSASAGDVSLYDHSRIAAALAAAIVRADPSSAILEAMINHDSEASTAPVVSLIAGDITGVQKFLYTLTARGAGRLLRGRSFYLQLLTEVVARWLLRELHLPSACIVYAGGGRFYALTQPLSAERLTSLRLRLSRLLLDAHGGSLYVALAETPVSAAELRGERPGGSGEVWRRAGEGLSLAKARKFSDLPPAILAEQLFSTRGGDPATPCSVCRAEIPVGSRRPGDNGELRCTLCDSLDRLGRDLRSAEYLAWRAVPPTPASQLGAPWESTLRALGWEARVLENDRALSQYASEAPLTLVMRLKDSDAMLPAREGLVDRSIGLGFQFVANVTPFAPDGTIAEFSDLAAASQGVNKLGVLRIDVDDLGAIFGRGIHPAPTLARVAALSSALRLYFEGWVAELCRRKNPFSNGSRWDGQDRVYVIYSGGDDVFVVGAWSALPSLAMQIADDFTAFTGGNPDVHLSAGIAVVDSHFPLYRAADLAGEALEARAKARREETGELAKNALDFLGITMTWAEARTVAGRAQELAGLVEPPDRGKPGRALLQTLQEIGAMERQSREQQTRHGRSLRGGQLVYDRWMWLATYHLARLAERTQAPWRQQVEELKRELFQPGGVARLTLAARWAELLIHKEHGST
ncbi:MAG: type III-A CRISPR-associated protein Cas10/Csm1 [Chloroflexota bacterium]